MNYAMRYGNCGKTFKKEVNTMLTENLREIEDALVRMEDASDIWQNGIIKAILRAVYNLLVWAIRRDRNDKE